MDGDSDVVMVDSDAGPKRMKHPMKKGLSANVNRRRRNSRNIHSNKYVFARTLSLVPILTQISFLEIDFYMIIQPWE